MNDKCQEPDCTGTYAADGFCDECGAQRSAAPAVLSASTQPATSSSRASQRTGTSSSRSTGRRTARGGLGAGMVDVPPVPLRDPASAVMAHPEVPEKRRFCGRCESPVGRSRDGKPGRTEGFCPSCRTPFSFEPRLKGGDRVGGRYEVLGCLAHGGLGWIYLARDTNVSDTVADRWVVLKGLIDTGDPDAALAAIAERRFLVSVSHPNIVTIHDLVEHPDPKTGVPVSYIVMEYIGGRSLRDVALDHRRAAGGPLPLPQVLAYALEVLPALGYLHGRDLIYCDFKPDNVIQAEEQLKLIDLGGVRRADDQESAIYGTPGYKAPEIGVEAPDVSTDLYTVGRSMAVLSFDFSGFTSTYEYSLPPVSAVPLFAQEESYHRLLRRTTHSDPARRFGSAADLVDQVTGVLREVLSAADGQARAALSTYFTPERRTFGTDDPSDGDASGVPIDLGAGALLPSPEPASLLAALPLPLPDPGDPSTPLLAALVGAEPADVVRALGDQDLPGISAKLALALARTEAGDPATARAELDALDPLEWRVPYYRGLIALAARDIAAAVREFDAVYDAVPGEPAVRLALGVAVELAGDAGAAARRYERVWRVDRSFVSAAFGLARARVALGQRTLALSTLDEVPENSSHRVAAQLAAVRIELSGGDTVAAGRRLAAVRLDPYNRARWQVALLQSTLDKKPRADREVRVALEKAYREFAAQVQDRPARIELVDRANAVRPRTWV
ncbi:serine/threonine protein kinase [Virgisporangium aliadipatigenens]|uniref:non-specific serine/threonine protein kinase n=1 Tax=Virgisporangium aliadipatigenens TaxID=741659 RepID=A0A8J3YT00_9ACTN|nr:serine/threonine-protein kinase [Virgisporangium aliadipatigenens]GIJ49878.1 serine/threonine protein kinase [Virgisporangium aliadipatigenens]